MDLLAEKIGSEVAIKNILFATDFSTISEAALPYVTALALRYGSAVHVVHALSDAGMVSIGAPDPAVMGAIYDGVHSAAQEKIQQLADRLTGFPHTTYVRHGAVLDVIEEIIREQAIDLLILGTHGRTGLGRMLMGSVAEQLFRETDCPVLTVGPGVPAVAHVLASRHDHSLPSPQVKFRQILYATDFTPSAAQSADYAVSLAGEFQSQLTLLHVFDGYGKDLHDHPGPIDTALNKLEGLVADGDNLRYLPESVVRFGDPAEQILEIACEYQADLIILGARPVHGTMGTATHFGRSTAHKVVVGANCPVLTLRN